jgi:hypothetical protein
MAFVKKYVCFTLGSFVGHEFKHKPLKIVSPKVKVILELNTWFVWLSVVFQH